MSETNHLRLPYIAPAQAQKHVTHNEALRRLDAVVQLAVLDAGLSAPPGGPDAGDRYIVGPSPTGAWAGHAEEVATFVDGSWEFALPEAGWIAFDLAAGVVLIRHADAWQALAGFAGTPDFWGVNASADMTNRLAVRSGAVLFSGIEAAEGGTGDLRLVLNKEADGDTASLLFQSGSSGRAEVGLAGDTDLVFKVSPDGSAWTEAIRIDRATGLPTILYDNAGSGLAATNLQDAVDEVAASGGAVASVFGRTGVVAAAAGDYGASQVDNDSAVSGATVKNALETLNTALAGKQAADGDLAALAALAATGLAARTGADAWAERTIAAGTRIDSVANGNGVAGNPTVNAAFPPGHLVGVGLAMNITDPANDIDIAAGSARDSTDADNLVLGSALTKRLDAAWAVGTNQGAVDVGSGGNGWWHAWLIKRSDTGVVDVLFSPSATAPTMPANYDRKRRIGTIVRTGGAALGFVQDGDRFRWKSVIGDIAATNPGTSAVTRTLSVPPGIRMLAELSVGFSTTGNPANNPGAIYISDLSQDDQAAGQLNAVSMMSYNAESAAMAPLSVMSNTSAQVRSRLQISAAGTVLYINTHGWTDTRGRV
jgi:hypothetical protein